MAEGDYDTETLRLGPTAGDTTTFELEHDHPSVTTTVSITALAGSAVIAEREQTKDGKSNWTTHFCRFDDAGTET